MINLFGYRDGDLHMHHSISENPLAAGSLPAMHAHEYYEVLYCVSGDCSFIVEGREYPLFPGCVMIMRPAEVHRVVFNSAAAYERIAINFSDAIIQSVDPNRTLLAPFWNRSQGSLNQYSSERIQTLMESQFGALRNSAVQRDEAAAAARAYDIRLTLLIGLLAFLKELNREFSLLNQAEKAEAAGGRSELLDYVNDHLFDRDFSTDMLKDRFFLSASQLNRSFNRLTGATIREYVMAKRLIRARFIIEGGGSAAEACEAACFNDYSAFYRAYRKKFLVPPKRARS